jgi:hypothetical protein
VYWDFDTLLCSRLSRTTEYIQEKESLREKICLLKFTFLYQNVAVGKRDSARRMRVYVGTENWVEMEGDELSLTWMGSPGEAAGVCNKRWVSRLSQAGNRQ